MATSLRMMRRGHCLGFKLNNIIFLKINVVSSQPFTRHLTSSSSTVYQHKSAITKDERKRQSLAGIKLSDINEVDKALRLTFNDGTQSLATFVWMRDNCQCPVCFDSMALARNLLVVDLDIKIKPKRIDTDGDDIKVTWSDSHVSTFTSKWLYETAFTPYSIESHQRLYQLEKETWGKDLVIDKFKYDDIMREDMAMLTWLKTVERKGVALIQNCPDDFDAGPKLSDKVAFVKHTHFGRSSSVSAREHVANLAYRSIKLGLHNDLPYYRYLPGIIFLHMIRQHEGVGGDSVVSDGLLGVEIFKKLNPEGYKLLCSHGIYYWDKGIGVTVGESSNFFKINKSPLIHLDPDGSLHALRINSQSREAFMDVPPEKVYDYYDAMIQLTRVLYDNACTFKLQNGEILVLDNFRCQHGREAFNSSSSRYLETSCIDWDEAQCKRRCLQEKLEVQ